MEDLLKKIGSWLFLIGILVAVIVGIIVGADWWQDSDAWAAAISTAMDSRDQQYREQQALTYRKQFSWAAQQEKIIQLINQQLWV